MVIVTKTEINTGVTGLNVESLGKDNIVIMQTLDNDYKTRSAVFNISLRSSLINGKLWEYINDRDEPLNNVELYYLGEEMLNYFAYRLAQGNEVLMMERAWSEAVNMFVGKDRKRRADAGEQLKC